MSQVKFLPLYVIDAAALAHNQSNPLRVVEHLVDCITDPKWRRERLCRQCDSWVTDDGLDKFPRRPGADNPTESCNGCWYSYLDTRRELEREQAILTGRRRKRKNRRRREK